MLLRAAGITTGCVRLVGQEPAPRKCVLVTDEGDKWSVNLDLWRTPVWLRGSGWLLLG